jgi:hypothetical protein
LQSGSLILLEPSGPVMGFKKPYIYIFVSCDVMAIQNCGTKSYTLIL